METKKEEKKEKWRLQKIELEFQRWGEDEGKYVGKISFENGDFEGFNFYDETTRINFHHKA